MNGVAPTTSKVMTTPDPRSPHPDSEQDSNILVKPILRGDETAYGKQDVGNGNGSQVAHDHGSPGMPAGLPDFSFDDREEEEPTAIVRQQPAMRRQMNIDLDDGPMDALFDRKLGLEDASPRPCIVPGNALHLIDDDPSPRSVTPPSVIIIQDTEEGRDEDGEQASDPHPDSERPTLRVRFRSRVRITSGLHRHRHDRSVSAPNPAGINGTRRSTPSSSVSDSPSSSISAPLRYQADENAAWGPLGRRLNAYAQANGWNRRNVLPSKPVSQHPDNMAVGGRGDTVGLLDERTSLLASSRGALYGSANDEGSREREASEIQQREQEIRNALMREEEAVFGKWPWRLLNHYWWWYRIEPLLCCCLDEVDYDDS